MSLCLTIVGPKDKHLMLERIKFVHLFSWADYTLSIFIYFLLIYYSLFMHVYIVHVAFLPKLARPESAESSNLCR